MKDRALKGLSRLQEVLESGEVVAPVFVRLTTSRGSRLMGVEKVECDGLDASITVTGESSQLHVHASEVIDIVAFKDGHGVPVFLFDLEGDDHVMEENRAATERREYVDAPHAASEHCRVQQLVYDIAVGEVIREVVLKEIALPRRSLEDPGLMAVSAEVLESLRGAA